MSDNDETPGVIGHDTPTDKKYRIWASMVFVFLTLGVGLPLWWETTAVPRVPLPYKGIRDLDELKLNMKVKLFLGCLQVEHCAERAHELLDKLNNLGPMDIFRTSLSHFPTGNTSIGRTKTITDLENCTTRFDQDPGDILILEAPFDLGDDLVYVSPNRSIFFSSNASMDILAEVLRHYFYQDFDLVLTRNALTEPTKFTLDFENRRRFPVSPFYDILLTVVNPDPENLQVDRKLADLGQDYFEPFLDELSDIANFSLKSQWLYLLPLGVNPKLVPNPRHFALSEEILPQIITPLETKLASQVSLHPTINLVAYVVPCSSSPIYIYTKNGHRLNKEHEFQAFLSPRWGGIVLINPPTEFCKSAHKNKVFKPNERLIAGVFLAHLRLLLGIPEKEELPDVKLAHFEGVKPRQWEVDNLYRIKTVEQLTSAKLTLQSLARLLREISNIVITEEVGNRISNALGFVLLASQLLNDGNLEDGFLMSKEAFVLAEAAFTDPSMLAMLYFPDVQKYAVYIPLFLPVMIPVLFSLKEIKNYLFCSD